ncbi:MAG: DUF6600 domain-containing protein, partial [Verrucomicrobiota bacterium]
MKSLSLVPLTALAILMASACNKQSPEAAQKIAELERKSNDAVQRQQDLEQQLADQKLAAERDAIERERMQLDEARADLGRQQGDAATAEADKLRQREVALAAREGKLEQLQSTLDDKQNEIDRNAPQLSERERDLAGSDGLEFQNESAPPPAVGDYGMFYDSLAAYGSWFETPDYGYVWQPVIVRDASWRPYLRGRWVCSDRGWTWLSDEPFGWATYHYGRWALMRGHGWVWAPGSEWAPSWVSWRYGEGHVGWAPLPPETLAYRESRWDSSVDATFGIGALWFNFVETRHFGGPANRYCLPVNQNNRFIQQTINITNIHVRDHQVISGGPRYNEVSASIGRPLPFYRLDMDRHGKPGRDALAMRPQIQGDRLRVAAPNMDAAWNAGLKPNKVKTRLEAGAVDRPEALRPEITDRFRQSREANRNQAEQSIQELGGRENFNQHRKEQLEANRRQTEQVARQQQQDTAKAQGERARHQQRDDANTQLDQVRKQQQQQAAQTQAEQAARQQQQDTAKAQGERARH